MTRERKLRLIQLSLLITGLSVIFFTYSTKEKVSQESILSDEIQIKVKNQLNKPSQSGDVFYNIEYSGLDLVGNRYVLKSKEAFTEKSNQELVNMNFVEASFYFKDGTTLAIESEKGQYNNKTLDMNFYENVKALYGESELFAQKAEYSNSKSFLMISDNVRVVDIKGTIVADKLFFDIKKQTLDIASFNDSKINANINLK
jgi:lipopolysaccharide assembly outer membrane protein LptD (OstA)